MEEFGLGKVDAGNLGFFGSGEEKILDLLQLLVEIPMVGNYDNSEGMPSMTQLLQAQESLFYPTQMSQASNFSEEWRRNTDY
ncbi:hypothetical protein QJS10_CPB13g00371 [Acorus calamus]|uniref:Uncharacterized protein n=1 Tax=Acorus calamus TaxID=4465 RepID=A0AAV9DGD1_ACOCL|nr:hypothetical protein QJS10_CPB13g00371 [Acorus calamus]